MQYVTIRTLGPADLDVVLSATHLFDEPARPDAARRFLGSDGHHLLIAFEDDAAVGFVSGIETTHPDKGTEMLLYELAVDEAARRRGIGTALVTALLELAQARGCYGMWVLTDGDNDAARATYAATDATLPTTHVMYSWTLRPDVPR